MIEEPENKKQPPSSLLFIILLFPFLMLILTFKGQISYLINHPTYQVGQIYKICSSDEYDPKDSTGVGSHTVVINHVNSSSVFYNTVGESTTFSRTPMEFYQLTNACK